MLLSDGTKFYEILYIEMYIFPKNPTRNLIYTYRINVNNIYILQS